MTENIRLMPVGEPVHPTNPNAEFAGQTILLVEDDLMILVAAVDLLHAMGAVKVEVASDVSSALAWLDDPAITLAVLDVNLNGETSLPIAQACAAAGTPIILTTGYGATDSALASFPTAPLCTKPYSADKLRIALRQLQTVIGT